MRGNSKPDASPTCGPFPHKLIVMDSYSSSHVDLLTNWFVDSTKFLVDDDTVAAAAGEDTTDVSMVQQMERLFAVMDSNSLSVDFDGQVPRGKTPDLPKDALSGDWGSAEHVTKTSVRIRTPWSCCRVASPSSTGLVSTWRRNATRAMTGLHPCTFLSLVTELMCALDHSSNAFALAQGCHKNRLAFVISPSFLLVFCLSFSFFAVLTLSLFFPVFFSVFVSLSPFPPFLLFSCFSSPLRLFARPLLHILPLLLHCVTRFSLSLAFPLSLSVIHSLPSRPVSFISHVCAQSLAGASLLHTCSALFLMHFTQGWQAGP